MPFRQLGDELLDRGLTRAEIKDMTKPTRIKKLTHKIVEERQQKKG